MNKLTTLSLKKLILLIGFTGLVFFCHGQNLISPDSWTIGSGSVGIFGKNGGTTENVREWGEAPNGQRAILWKAIPDANNDADGGWTTSTFNIDHTKMYRFSVWIKKTNSTDGNTYIGCNSYPDPVLRMDGTPNSNPYFWNGDLPELDKWYLLVGYIHGSGDNSTTSYGAIYDGETGNKVGSMADYKFPATATTARHRAYLYYDTNTSDRQYFYAPRVDMVTGDEPPIESLGFTPGAFPNGDVSFTGKVGIGTSEPFVNSKLDITGPYVVGKFDSQLHLHTANNLYGMFMGSHSHRYGVISQGSNYYSSENFTARSEYSSGIIYSDGNISFFANSGLTSGDNFTPSKRFYINNSGNIGIGTTSPDNKLDVKGTIRAEEVKVETGWADYVFHEDYELKSLSEVSTYIEENYHLPGIPTAEEVAENGIKLGEMNVKLLEKIEELTLYQIELLEKLELMDERIKELEQDK